MNRMLLLLMSLLMCAAPAFADIAVIEVGGDEPAAASLHSLAVIIYTGPAVADCGALAGVTGIVMDSGIIACDQPGATPAARRTDMATAIAAGLNAGAAAGYAAGAAANVITIVGPAGSTFNCRIMSTEEDNGTALCESGYDLPPTVHNVCFDTTVPSSSDGRAAQAGGWQFGSVKNIPTLTEWGLIVVAMLLVAMGAAFIVRRRMGEARA